MSAGATAAAIAAATAATARTALNTNSRISTEPHFIVKIFIGFIGGIVLIGLIELLKTKIKSMNIYEKEFLMHIIKIIIAVALLLLIISEKN